MSVQNKLAKLQIQNGKLIQLKQIHEATGISMNTLSALRHGKESGIKYETIHSLCKFFEIDIGEFLELDKDAS